MPGTGIWEVAAVAACFFFVRMFPDYDDDGLSGYRSGMSLRRFSANFRCPCSER